MSFPELQTFRRDHKDVANTPHRFNLAMPQPLANAVESMVDHLGLASSQTLIKSYVELMMRVDAERFFLHDQGQDVTVKVGDRVIDMEFLMSPYQSEAIKRKNMVISEQTYSFITQHTLPRLGNLTATNYINRALAFGLAAHSAALEQSTDVVSKYTIPLSLGEKQTVVLL